MLLKRQVPSVPDIGIPFVDVRDVAKAHVAAMTRGTPGFYNHTPISKSCELFFERSALYLVHRHKTVEGHSTHSRRQIQSPRQQKIFLRFLYD